MMLRFLLMLPQKDDEGRQLFIVRPGTDQFQYYSHRPSAAVTQGTRSPLALAVFKVNCSLRMLLVVSD